MMNSIQKLAVKALGIKVPKSRGTNRPPKGNKKVKDLIDDIIRRYKDQTRKDIDKWRKSLAMAQHPEKPRMDYLLGTIYDLMTNGHLQAVIMIRKTATLNTEFKIKSRKTGEVDEDKTRFIKCKWFYDMMNDLLDTPFFGTTVLQLLSFTEGKVNYALLPREHVVARLKILIPDLSKPEKHISYAEGFEKVLIEMGNPEDLGILNNLVPDLIWLRNVLQAWAEFTDKYGIPMITATTHQQDDEYMDYILDKLLELGESSANVFPKGTELDIKEADRTDAYMTFDKKIERHEKTISKHIIGGTMITDDGSSKSQSEVHANNLDKKIAKAERRSIAFVVNDQLIPNLIDLGWGGFTEDDEFVFDTSESLSLKEHWKVVKEVMNTYEVDESWISKTFNVPITGKKQVAPPAAEGGAKSADSVAMINDTLKDKGFRMPTYSVCNGIQAKTMVPDAAFSDEMKRLSSDLIKQLYNKKDTLITEAKIIATEAIRFISGLHNGWSTRTDIAYNATDHLALSLMEYNLFEFSASKTEAKLAAMSELLINKEKFQIRTLTDFKREALKVVDKFDTVYATAEHNLSIAVGQGGSNWHRMVADKDAIPYWQYQTVGDSNVRPKHAALDGMIFSIDDKSASGLIAPNGYGCRCENIQHPYDVSPDRIAKGSQGTELLGDEFNKSQFNINRGDTAEVFTKKQFYSKNKGLPDKLNKMNFKALGLKDYEKMTGLKSLAVDDTITKDNIKELFRIDGKSANTDFMGFEDYLKRKLILKKGAFEKNTTGRNTAKDQIRHQLFPHLENVISTPNEVWLYEHKPKRFSTRYIKYYNNHAVVVDTDLGANNLEIKEWYSLKGDEKKIRKGLLIKDRSFIQ